MGTAYIHKSIVGDVLAETMVKFHEHVFREAQKIVYVIELIDQFFF